jgi:hypothetical protein
MKYLKKFFNKENIPSGDLIRKNVKREDLAGESSEYVIINNGIGSWMREITFISLLKKISIFVELNFFIVTGDLSLIMKLFSSVCKW